jgi:hypothetical protein
MMNTIILLHNEARLNRRFELKKFQKGDLIWGADENPEELKRWSASEEDAARAELAKHRCVYDPYHDELAYIEEYALEWFEADEDGEFLSGSDFELAQEAEIGRD